MSFRALTFVIAVTLAGAVPRSLAAETLRIASPQRGSWEGRFPSSVRKPGSFRNKASTLISYIPRAAARPCRSWSRARLISA